MKTTETTARLLLRLPGDLHADLARMASEDERSLNSEIIWLLSRAVRQATAK